MYGYSQNDRNYDSKSHRMIQLQQKMADRSNSCNPITLLLPQNTDTIQLNIKVKFKGSDNSLLRSMGPPFLSIPWMNNYNPHHQQYHKNSQFQSKLQQFMELPIYKNTYVSHNNYGSSSSASNNFFSPKQNSNQTQRTKRQSQSKQQSSYTFPYKNDGLKCNQNFSVDNPLTSMATSVPKFTISKTISHTIQQPRTTPLNGSPSPYTYNSFQSADYNAITPVFSSNNHNSFTNSNNNKLDFLQKDNRTNREQLNSIQKPVFDKQHSQSNQINSDKSRSEYINSRGSVSNSQKQEHHDPQLSKKNDSQINQLQNFYPSNEQFQPMSFNDLPFSSTISNKEIKPSESYDEHNISHRYNAGSIIQEESEPLSNSNPNSSIKKQENKMFNSIRKTVSIIPQIQSHQPSHNIQNLSTKPFSNVRVPSIASRPSQIKHSLEIREPSQTHQTQQYRYGSSIPPSSHLQHAGSLKSQNNYQDPLQSSISPITITNSPFQINCRKNNDSLFISKNSQRKDNLSDKFDSIMDHNQIQPNPHPDSLNFKVFTNSATNPVQNTSFGRYNISMRSQSVTNRSSSRSPDRHIFNRPFFKKMRNTSLSVHQECQQMRDCPYKKIVLRTKGILVTKLQKNVEEVEVPQHVVRRWTQLQVEE